MRVEVADVVRVRPDAHADQPQPRLADEHPNHVSQILFGGAAAGGHAVADHDEDAVVRLGRQQLLGGLAQTRAIVVVARRVVPAWLAGRRLPAPSRPRRSERVGQAVVEVGEADEPILEAVDRERNCSRCSASAIRTVPA